MAQWVRVLPSYTSKRKSSHPNTHSSSGHACTPALGHRDRRTLGACWPVCLAEVSVGLLVQWETLSQAIRWEVTEEGTWHPSLASAYTITRACALTHSCTYLSLSPHYFCVICGQMDSTVGALNVLSHSPCSITLLSREFYEPISQRGNTEEYTEVPDRELPSSWKLWELPGFTRRN